MNEALSAASGCRRGVRLAKDFLSFGLSLKKCEDFSDESEEFRYISPQ